jgi:protein-S-isoprenylcysteine O-methyltransferase Ste14
MIKIKSIKSLVLVLLQFIFVAGIVIYCGVWGNDFSKAFTVVGFLLGVWSIIVMRFRVSVLPDFTSGQVLFTNGPYKFVRHPMYTSLLLASLSWVSNRFDLLSIGLWMGLLAVLLVKINYEESMLNQEFKDYKHYSKNTKKLIPFVY